MGDTSQTAVVKMCDGNPGAMQAICELLRDGHQIAPDDLMCGMGQLLFLDTLGIYGTDIYVLYSDICGRSVRKMCGVLFAVQYGFFSASVLKDACARQDYSGRELVPVDNLCVKVQVEHPNLRVFD
jgi:hypothetical protein